MIAQEALMSSQPMCINSTLWASLAGELDKVVIGAKHESGEQFAPPSRLIYTRINMKIFMASVLRSRIN